MWSDSVTQLLESSPLFNMTKLFQWVQLKNKPVVFSQECRLIYTHSSLLMLQIRLSEVCHCFPTGPATGNIYLPSFESLR